MGNTAHAILWAGMEGLDAAREAGAVQPGGVTLFARNLDPDPRSGPARCHALVSALRTRWAPLVVALDQEGGAVSRLRAWVGPTPPLRQIWRSGGTAACARWGRLWGQGLALLGIQVDFAPVADRHDGHPGTGLGDRSACADPMAAAQAAGAFLWGLEGTGVRGCLKHFPGLGGTSVDSHRDLPVVTHAEVLAANLLPFRCLAHADRLVMVAHVATPETGGLPASLHRGTVAANAHGIQARWIPDALEMGACAGIPWEERLTLALEAGHEALLVCSPGSVATCASILARMPESLWRSANARFESLRRQMDRPMPVWDQILWDAWVANVQREAEAVAGWERNVVDPTA